MRTVIYARFSSDNQNHCSTADQITACRERADREGWTIVAAFEDAAISGVAGIGEDQRPGLNAMMALVEAGGIDQVLTESTDRISRHVGDSHNLRERIEYAGARLFTLFDGTVTPIVALVKGFTDSQFRTDLAARVRRGQIGANSQGRDSGPPSYGYRVANRIDEHGRLIAGLREIDEEKAAVVRRIFRAYLAGIGPRAIAGELNAEGIPAPRGGRWQISTILGAKAGFGILRNRLYIGEMTYGRTKAVMNPATRQVRFKPNLVQAPVVTMVPHLRIVDDESFAKAQAQMAERGFVRIDRARRPKKLLSGLCKCGVCGSNYVVVSKRSWRCNRSVSENACINARSINNPRLEAEVLAQLKAEMLSPEAVTEYLREYHRDYARQIGEVTGKKASLERKLADATRKVERLIEAFAIGGSEFVEIREMLSAARNDRDMLSADLASIEAIPVLALHPHLANEYKQEVEALELALNGNAAQKLETIPRIRAMIARVELTPNPTEKGLVVNVVRRMDEVLALASGQTAFPQAR